MIITLTGENTFAISQAEKQLRMAFTEKHGANAIEIVDAEELTPARLPDLLQGVNLFAPVRLVIIKNISANKQLVEPLTEALAHAADDSTVVIADSALDKRTKLYKFLKIKSTFKHFEAPSDAALIKWLQDEGARLGGQLGQPEARHLLSRVGNDQWLLASEISKLVDYRPQVSIDSINVLTELSPEGNAFELLDAALAGRSADVVRLVQILKTVEDPYKFSGLFAGQMHALAVVAAAGDRSADVIAKDAALHPFVVRKAQSAASRLGSKRISQIVRDVATCDTQLKSTGIDPWELLQICLQKIATKNE